VDLEDHHYPVDLEDLEHHLYLEDLGDQLNRLYQLDPEVLVGLLNHLFLRGPVALVDRLDPAPHPYLEPHPYLVYLEGLEDLLNH
jgi:hypothetical protein